MPEQVEGYCTNVWFNETLRFIESNKEQPFLLYLPTNAPHGPFLVAPEYSEPYRQAGLSEILANFYGMITNFDDNMGRLLEGLENLGLADNTILIFMTDNGSQVGTADEEFERYFGAIEEGAFRGFNAGMRGRKGSEYDAGHRVPFFIRWPAGGLEGGWDVPQLTAHIDVPPTLMELAGIEQTEGPPLHGASLAPLLRGDSESWPERTLFVHSQRIEYPEKWRKSAVMTERHRLVNGEELYDIEADPGQANDLASERPELVAELRRSYEAWWQSLSSGFDEYVRIGVGSEAENPAYLTAHDWHAPQEQVPGNQGHIRDGLLGGGGDPAGKVSRQAAALAAGGRGAVGGQARPSQDRRPQQGTGRAGWSHIRLFRNGSSGWSGEAANLADEARRLRTGRLLRGSHPASVAQALRRQRALATPERRIGSVGRTRLGGSTETRRRSHAILMRQILFRICGIAPS